MAGLYWSPLTTNETGNSFPIQSLSPPFSSDISLGRNQSSEEAMIFYENRLLGKPRIRMLKVIHSSIDILYCIPLVGHQQIVYGSGEFRKRDQSVLFELREGKGRSSSILSRWI